MRGDKAFHFMTFPKVQPRSINFKMAVCALMENKLLVSTDLNEKSAPLRENMKPFIIISINFFISYYVPGHRSIKTFRHENIYSQFRNEA